MKLPLYLPRTLFCENKNYNEADLLKASSHIVVLAEPGAGKTELLQSLSRQLGCPLVTASVFGQIGAQTENEPLVIDAFDELSKLDATGIHKVLGNARQAKPTHLVISSRSSEWDNASTASYKDFLGHEPIVARLREFDEAEQRAIFEHHVPGEDFIKFQSEVARFDLGTLLPNPQFLKLFADAFVESGRTFLNKRAIFEQAVERLAKEANTSVTNSKTSLSRAKKVALASEVFAKLLLSGAEGVSTREASENRIYPLLSSTREEAEQLESILSSKLFRPGDTADHHRPVHKIVSEYCAANYLTQRIADPSDPLTISKCLPIIAPNSIVRDELRGMLGWMASVGNKSVQEVAIDLDPYAVLANGDPSQLEASSKSLLIRKLKEIEAKDPYFRGKDFWRRFSVAGFFTSSVVNEIRPLIAAASDGHLRNLILELLAGSPAANSLTTELQQIALSPEQSEHTRVLATNCLLDANSHNHLADLASLIFESSHTSLKLAAKIITSKGVEQFENEYVVGFLRVCANLFPNHNAPSENVIGRRYFIKPFVASLDLSSVVWLLDNLTDNLSCTCGERRYRCDCRNGTSKIVGSLLDRYFLLSMPPHDPIRVWRWVCNLNFHNHMSAEQSTAVRVLQSDTSLRAGLWNHVLVAEKDPDKLDDLLSDCFGWRSCHDGLRLSSDDYRLIADKAFEKDNVVLWEKLVPVHQWHPETSKRGPDERRAHMRSQAREKPSFMRIWAKSNREAKLRARSYHQSEYLHSRRMARRQNRVDDDVRAANIKFVHENRELVEQGRHWGCLARFAELVLMDPQNIVRDFGDADLVKTALRNCLDFITPYLPSLRDLAALHCASQRCTSESILFAACLEIWRSNGNLEGVSLSLLRAFRTNINMGFSAVSETEREGLTNEVDRLIFPDNPSAEQYLREYLEPQLAIRGCSNPEIWLLRNEKLFGTFQAKFSIEWLKRYRAIEVGPLAALFEIAAQFGDQEELKEVIAERCAEYFAFWPNDTHNEAVEQKRTFWLLRSWYYLNDAPGEYWRWLKKDKNIVLALYEQSGRMNRSDHPYWPSLSAKKVEKILDAFTAAWPKVELIGGGSSDDSNETKAYRFLSELVWSINSDGPNEAIPVLDRLLADNRFDDMHADLRSIKATQLRKLALKDFAPPTLQETVNLLDRNSVVSVEGLRQLIIDELEEFQNAIDGGEFNSSAVFYEKGHRIGENKSTERIAERLNLRLQPQGITITPEHQLKAAKRSDFTATKMIGGDRRLLVTEVKGQWHRELYTAASEQLHKRYSIHPDAEQQGIYLVLWFGKNVEVAGVKHSISNSKELKASIEAQMPIDLLRFVDVFVLDVSN